MNVIFILVEMLVFLLCIISLIIGSQNKDPYRGHKWTGVFVYSYLISSFLIGSSIIGGIYEGELQTFLASLFVIVMFILSLFGGGYIFDIQERKQQEHLISECMNALRQVKSVLKLYSDRFGPPNESEDCHNQLHDFEVRVDDLLNGKIDN
jgi:hypothetical protein